MRAQLFLATTGIGIARAERRGNGEWDVTHGLADEAVRCLAPDPLNPEVVYAGTLESGMLRSGDRGVTWRGSGLRGTVITSLTVSRHTAGTLYAGTKPAGVFKSTDGGAHWRELEGFQRIRSRRFWFSPAEKPFTAYVQGLAVSPADPDVLLAGIEFGAVVRSTDAGETWSGHRRGALRDCHTIVFHATDGTRAYEAGGNSGGAALSTDGGQHWLRVGKGFDRHYGWACAADPAEPDVWYVSVAPSPYRAHGSAGASAAIFRAGLAHSWQQLGGGLPDPLDHMPYALLTDPAAPGDVYAGMANGEVWFSSDRGDAWTRLPFSLGRIHRTMVML